MTVPVQWRASLREGFVDIPPGGTDAFTRLDYEATNQSCLSTLSRMREKRPIVNVYREDTHTDAAGRG